jgi:2-C-methyl-D-erythritol 4-phosphate cytidylyltransferase
VTTWIIVLAAGGGSRFGGRKQFAKVGGERAVDRVVRTARSVSDGIVVVLPPGTAWDGPPVDFAVDGGATRAASVRCGLAAVPDQATVVLVHDAAHPLASRAQFEAVLAALHDSGADAALPVVPLVEALKRVTDGVVSGHPSRAGLTQAQTPHAFRAAALRAAHAGAPEAVEDVELVCAAGGRAVVVAGDPRNIHVTTPEELEVADALSKA